MKSLGNGWKKAQEARIRARESQWAMEQIERQIEIRERLKDNPIKITIGGGGGTITGNKIDPEPIKTGNTPEPKPWWKLW